MDYELEVFEVYDDSDQQTSKRHSKHTRKKCKQKQKASVLGLENTDNDISKSKNSVVGSDRRHLSLRESILSVFTKLVVWRDQKRYQSTVPEKIDSPHSSKDFRKGYIPCGTSHVYTFEDTISRRCCPLK
uniref:Uncharacterized protein LOC114343654 n=1 Tax=Diabrotica virgifera virgifera TaxID=50390 RepID=A0A6P7GXZ0_DIAVI